MHFSTIAEKLSVLTELEKQIRDCQRREEVLMSQMKIYDLPEILFFSEPVRGKLRNFMTALNLIVNWERDRDENKIKSLKKIRFDVFEKIISSHLEKITNVMSIFQNEWKFLSAAKRDVEFFKETLPFFKSLQSKELKTRHWENIRKITGKDFNENAKDFNIKMILESNLLNFLLPIQDIFYAASLESKLEENLNNILTLWTTLKHDMKFKDEDLTSKVVEDCRIVTFLLSSLDLLFLNNHFLSRLLKNMYR